MSTTENEIIVRVARKSIELLREDINSITDQMVALEQKIGRKQARIAEYERQIAREIA